MDIKKELSNSHKVLIVLPNRSNSQEYILSLIKTMENIDKICYVTLHQSRDFLLNLLKENNIPADKFYFVDCISAYIKEPEPVKNAYFAPAPYALESIKKGISQAIGEGYSFIIFDSLSVLSNYGPLVPAGVDTIARFIKSFLDALEKAGGIIIFLCNEKNKRALLIEESLVIFDKVICV
jgi:hypothetical protein